MPIILRVAMVLAIVGLGAVVVYVGAGGLGVVATSLGKTFSGFVAGVTATPSPSPTVVTISDAPTLAPPEEPYTNVSTVDLVVSVPSALVGNTEHRIRVYLALKDLPPQAIQEVPIADSPRTVIPVELTKGINDFTVTIIGPGGESDTSAVVRYVLDTSKPKVTITSPKNNAVINGKSVTIKGKVQARSTLIARNADNEQSLASTAEADGTFTLSLPLTTGVNHITIEATDPAGNASTAELTVRRGNGKLTVTLSRVRLLDLAQVAAAVHQAQRDRHRPRRQPVVGRRRDLHAEHPGDPDGHRRNEDRSEWQGVVPDHDPQGRGPGRRQCDRVDLERPVRFDDGRHRHHDHEVAAGRRAFDSPAGVDSGRRRSYHPRMPMWRCPHCGIPQAETARCWVCHRSSTACLTCRNFRRSVAGKAGYCALDRQRRLLRGDEIRACWEASPVPFGTPEMPAARALLPMVDGTPAARLEFVEVVDVVARTPGREPEADTLPAEPRWSLWDDLGA